MGSFWTECDRRLCLNTLEKQNVDGSINFESERVETRGKVGGVVRDSGRVQLVENKFLDCPV